MTRSIQSFAVLLAIAVTGDRLSRTQGIGLVAAGGALVLVTI